MIVAEEDEPEDFFDNNELEDWRESVSFDEKSSERKDEE